MHSSRSKHGFASAAVGVVLPMTSAAAQETSRVSVDSSGAEGNGNSGGKAISADGQIVAFDSLASNLVPSDTNGTWDVLIHDCSSGLTERVSVDSSGSQGNGKSYLSAISANGTIVAFGSEASNLVAGDTSQPGISADGTIVTFSSVASNLVGNDTNTARDVFAYEPCCTVDAAWSNYGAGFPGSTGVPSFISRVDPVLGTRLTLDLANSYGNETLGLLLVGLQEASIPTIWGGDLLVLPRSASLLIVRWIGISIESEIPDHHALCGLEYFLQALEIDPGAARGVSFTAGLKLLLGH